MSDFKPITFSEEFSNKYWQGPSNRLLRYYTYLQRAFTLVNEAKNYVFIVFGGYWTAKAVVIFGYQIDPNIILLLGLVGIPIMILIGRWHLFRAQKSMEFINSIHGTVTQYGAYNMQVAQLELLEQILKEIRSNNQPKEQNIHD